MGVGSRLDWPALWRGTEDGRAGRGNDNDEEEEEDEEEDDDGGGETAEK